MSLARDVYAAQLKANPADAALHAGLVELELARADAQNLQRHGRDAVQTLAALHALATSRPTAERTSPRVSPCSMPTSSRAARRPRRTPRPSQALGNCCSKPRSDPLDTDRLRESALAWQQTGEIGLRASQTEPACRYLGLAGETLRGVRAAQRLNAIDKLRGKGWMQR